jgi:hypothetical protein
MDQFSCRAERCGHTVKVVHERQVKNNYGRTMTESLFVRYNAVKLWPRKVKGQQFEIYSTEKYFCCRNSAGTIYHSVQCTVYVICSTVCTALLTVRTAWWGTRKKLRVPLSPSSSPGAPRTWSRYVMFVVLEICSGAVHSKTDTAREVQQRYAPPHHDEIGFPSYEHGFPILLSSPRLRSID